MRRIRLLPALILVLACFVAAVSSSCSSTPQPVSTSAGSQVTAATANDAVLARAFADRTSNLEVEGEGTVTRILADDTEGDRHQRFIVRLASGQTLLVAHNIDIAPRVDPLQVGDVVSFKGVYEWNEQGGLVHWTHVDPSGSHPPGWIKHNGTTYQ